VIGVGAPSRWPPPAYSRRWRRIACCEPGQLAALAHLRGGGPDGALVAKSCRRSSPCMDGAKDTEKQDRRAAIGLRSRRLPPVAEARARGEDRSSSSASSSCRGSSSPRLDSCCCCRGPPEWREARLVRSTASSRRDARRRSTCACSASRCPLHRPCAAVTVLYACTASPERSVRSTSSLAL